MNVDKKILNLRGKEIPKSGATQDEIDALPKKETERVFMEGSGEPKIVKIKIPDRDKLEKETVGNVILNCLENYKPKGLSRKESFYVGLIGQAIVGGGKNVELKDKLMRFLVEILEDSIGREEEEEYEDEKGKTKTRKVEKGIYKGWVIAQVLSELLPEKELKEFEK